jgi:hypothetical protein
VLDRRGDRHPVGDHRRVRRQLAGETNLSRVLLLRLALDVPVDDTSY